MEIRKATIRDLGQLYKIGRNTPELKVNPHEPFMARDEFRWSITNRDGVFLTAREGNRIVGFAYASAGDAERPMTNRYACFVYLAVVPDFRKRGIARMLYGECTKKLKERGITHIYALANAKDKPIINFNRKLGLKKGNAFIWMDRKL